MSDRQCLNHNRPWGTCEVTDPRACRGDRPVDVLAFAVSMFDGPHRHHRHCIHNLSVDEQWERQRIDIGEEKATDEQMNQLGFSRDSLVSITPDEWEIEVPDLDWSRFDEAAE